MSALCTSGFSLPGGCVSDEVFAVRTSRLLDSFFGPLLHEMCRQSMNRVMLHDEKEFDFFIEVKMVGILIWRLYKVSAKSTFSFREIMKRIFFTKKMSVCMIRCMVDSEGSLGYSQT